MQLMAFSSVIQLSQHPNQMIRYPLLLFFAFLLSGTSAQEISKYDINVRFFPEDASMWGYPVANDAFMRGTAEIAFEGSFEDSLAFYLHGELEIDSILMEGKSVEFITEKVLYEEDYSMVATRFAFGTRDLDNGNELVIAYSGFFNPSRARSLSDYMHIQKEKGVFLRATGYSNWFPFPEGMDIFDKVPFGKVTVTTPRRFKTVVSGVLEQEVCDDQLCETTWNPGTSSLFGVQCTARPYEVQRQGAVTLYHVGGAEQAASILRFCEELTTFYASNYRPAADLETLHIIEMPKYGDISSDNVVGISTSVYENFLEDFYAKSTLAHELVHPYVSLPLPEDSPLTALVMEGFPSFFHLYAMHRLQPREEFDLEQMMIRVERSYMKKKSTGEDRRGNRLPEEKAILAITKEEISVYKDLFILSDRVRLFLYDLYKRMGVEAYDSFLKELFQQSDLEEMKFRGLILQYLPDDEGRLNLWLRSTDYPSDLRLEQ